MQSDLAIMRTTIRLEELEDRWEITLAPPKGKPPTLDLEVMSALKAFATKNGYIEISPVFSDNALRDIFLALGLNDLSRDPRFAAEKKQLENREALNALLAERFRARTTETWMAQLEPQGIFCARVHSFAEAAEHPQQPPIIW